MEHEKVAEQAGKLFDSGFNCAEAVGSAVLQSRVPERQEHIIPLATYFGGGMGCSLQDTCGAISGAVLALGFIAGREDPQAEWKETGSLAEELRKRFIIEFGSTNCAQLRMQFGEPHLPKCRQATCKAAELISRLIEEAGLQQPCAA